MAQTARRRSVSPEDQWVCSLSASPDRVRAGKDTLRLALSLSNPQFDVLPPTQKITVYRSNFTFTFDGSNDALTTAISNASGKNPIVSEDGIQFSFAIPDVDVPDGDYEILVTATPTASFPPDLMLPPNPVVGSAEISVITRLIETQSQVTMQRTFAGPTNDRALWPAIRNRTAAIGFDRYKKFID